VRTEHQEASEVKFSCGYVIEQRGKAAHEAGGGNSAIRFVLRQAQFVDAVDIEARAGAGAVDAARLDLGEVGKQGGEQLVRATDEASRGDEQFGVEELRRIRSFGKRMGGIRAQFHALHATPWFSELVFGALASDREQG
jgi:hypothetical protein